MLVQRRDQCEAALQSIPGRSDHKAVMEEWKSLWRVKVPSKISIFLWRLARHSLPCGDVLHRRNMAQSNVCFFCGSNDSWKHSLIECTMARCILALEKEPLVEAICGVTETDAKAWLATIFKILP